MWQDKWSLPLERKSQSAVFEASSVLLIWIICDMRSSQYRIIAISHICYFCHRKFCCLRYAIIAPSQYHNIAISHYRNITYLLFLPLQVLLFAICDHHAIARSQYHIFKCFAICLIAPSQMAICDVGLGSKNEI